MKKVISKHFIIINGLLERRYRTLLLSLILMIIAPSLLEGWAYQGLISFLLNSVTVLLCIYAIHESKKQLYIGMSLALLVIIVNQFGIFKTVATFDFYFSFIIYIFFYAYVAYRLLIMIFITENVRAGVLYASIIVYLFIGILGGYLFMLIENSSPGSLNNLQIENLKNPSKFFYFSFITLSTLGYGDITPASAPAQTLSLLISVIGPLYLTILVALLVSRFEHSDVH
jgi:hypothetical protein